MLTETEIGKLGRTVAEIAAQYCSFADFSGIDRTTLGVLKNFSGQKLCIAQHFFKLAALNNDVKLLANFVLAAVATLQQKQREAFYGYRTG